LRSDLIKASNLGGVRGGESSLSRYRPDTGKSEENAEGVFQIFWRKAREKGRYVCVWVLMEGECLYVNICMHAQTYSQTYRHKKTYKRALSSLSLSLFLAPAHTRTHAHTHTNTHARTRTHIHTHMRTIAGTRTEVKHFSTHTHMHTFTNTQTHIRMFRLSLPSIGERGGHESTDDTATFHELMDNTRGGGGGVPRLPLEGIGGGPASRVPTSM